MVCNYFAARRRSCLVCSTQRHSPASITSRGQRRRISSPSASNLYCSALEISEINGIASPFCALPTMTVLLLARLNRGIFDRWLILDLRRIPTTKSMCCTIAFACVSDWQTLRTTHFSDRYAKCVELGECFGELNGNCPAHPRLIPPRHDQQNEQFQAAARASLHLDH